MFDGGKWACDGRMIVAFLERQKSGVTSVRWPFRRNGLAQFRDGTPPAMQTFTRLGGSLALPES